MQGRPDACLDGYVFTLGYLCDYASVTLTVHLCQTLVTILTMLLHLSQLEDNALDIN